MEKINFGKMDLQFGISRCGDGKKDVRGLWAGHVFLRSDADVLDRFVSLSYAVFFEKSYAEKRKKQENINLTLWSRYPRRKRRGITPDLARLARTGCQNCAERTRHKPQDFNPAEE